MFQTHPADRAKTTLEVWKPTFRNLRFQHQLIKETGAMVRVLRKTNSVGNIDIWQLFITHQAACATSGVLASRAVPPERVVARVCRDGGTHVAHNLRLADMNFEAWILFPANLSFHIWNERQEGRVDKVGGEGDGQMASGSSHMVSCGWRVETAKAG